MTEQPHPLPPSPSPGEVAAALLLPEADRDQVAVDGHRLVVHRAGPTGPGSQEHLPVLLLHGVPQTAVAFRHLLPELARDRRVLAPDLPGLGESEARGPYDVESLVDTLAALVLHEVDGPVDVVGHDWGGTLALALAAARPEMVRRLVLVNAPYRQLDLVRSVHVMLSALPVVPEALLALTGRRGLRWLLRLGWRSGRPAPGTSEGAALDAYVDAYAPAERRAAMLAYARATVRPRLRRTLSAALAKPKVDHPGKHYASAGSAVSVERALVVWGAADPVLPVRVGEAVVRELGPGVDMVTLPGIGHSPLEEAPDVAVPVVAEFLRQGSGGSTARAENGAGSAGSGDADDES
jgi:pimeloyl-ACP methyl ester carboxylesterase